MQKNTQRVSRKKRNDEVMFYLNMRRATFLLCIGSFVEGKAIRTDGCEGLCGQPVSLNCSPDRQDCYYLRLDLQIQQQKDAQTACVLNANSVSMSSPGISIFFAVII